MSRDYTYRPKDGHGVLLGSLAMRPPLPGLSIFSTKGNLPVRSMVMIVHNLTQENRADGVATISGPSAFQSTSISNGNLFIEPFALVVPEGKHTIASFWAEPTTTYDINSNLPGEASINLRSKEVLYVGSIELGVENWLPEPGKIFGSLEVKDQSDRDLAYLRTALPWTQEVAPKTALFRGPEWPVTMQVLSRENRALVR